MTWPTQHPWTTMASSLNGAQLLGGSVLSCGELVASALEPSNEFSKPPCFFASRPPVLQPKFPSLPLVYQTLTQAPRICPKTIGDPRRGSYPTAQLPNALLSHSRRFSPVFGSFCCPMSFGTACFNVEIEFQTRMHFSTTPGSLGPVISKSTDTPAPIYPHAGAR
jgi:hypothetical protein